MGIYSKQEAKAAGLGRAGQGRAGQARHDVGFVDLRELQSSLEQLKVP